jgi:hypothetical protein
MKHLFLMESFIPWFHRYLISRLIELVIVLREFRLDETYFFSLFLNILSCHPKYLCGNLFNINKTHVKLPLTSLSGGFMAQFPTQPLFGNSAEAFRSHETLSTPMKLSSPLSPSIQ